MIAAGLKECYNSDTEQMFDSIVKVGETVLRCVDDLVDMYDDFKGEVLVSLQSKACSSSTITSLVDPKIEKTKIGIRMTCGNNWVEVDGRGITRIGSAGLDDYHIEYGCGIMMSIVFLAA